MVIFISYRRKDYAALGTVGRLRDSLAEKYGNSNIFVDVDSLKPGEDFRCVINDAVTSSDVFLIIIGPQWLEVLQNKKHTIDDFVILEIESALNSNKHIVPVLINGTKMPGREELPDSVAGIAYKNAFELDVGRHYNHHTASLIEELDDWALQEKRKADEVKLEAEEEERNLAEVDKESARLQREAVFTQKQTEREKKKIEKLRKRLYQQQGGTAGAESKNKTIVIAAVALVIVILTFVGIKSFSGADDDGVNSGTKRASGDINPKNPGGQAANKPTSVQQRTGCVVIITLSDDGKGIPDDVEMELVTSDGGSYGTLTKGSGVLKATIAEASPPKGEKFEVKFKNKNYALKSNVVFKSDHFKETDPGVFCYKLKVQLNVCARFDIVPSLSAGFIQYKKPLLELLKSPGLMKVFDDAGSEIKEARVSYEKNSDKIHVVMPAGWSFNGGDVKLKIDWPYFEPVNLEIGKNGLVGSEAWGIKLRKYDLNLSLLKSRMPRFKTVCFLPTFGDSVGIGLEKMIEFLLENEEATYLKSYLDINGASDVLSVPSQQGDLVFSGGTIHDEGVFVKGAVKRGQLATSFLGFPKGLYVAALPIPFQNYNPPGKGGGYLYTTVPSIVALHLQARPDGESQPFEFRVVIEQGLKMTQYLTTLKLKSWNQRSNQWTLTSVAGVQQALNLILIVSQTSNGGLSVDYTDIVINGDKNYKFDPLAKSRWGMTIEPKQGGVMHQRLTMKLNHRSENRQSFVQNLERNYALSRQDFDRLKTSYELPSDYPYFTKSIFRKLGE